MRELVEFGVGDESFEGWRERRVDEQTQQPSYEWFTLDGRRYFDGQIDWHRAIDAESWKGKRLRARLP